jgi:uridine phosphorylase
VSAYLRPTAPIAPAVLLPSDPALALALAQEVLTKPLMANHSHGLWGYAGTTERGDALSVQASGIGGPSAAAVLRELAAHGARRAIRIGRCETLDPALRPGTVVLVRTCHGADGTSRALGWSRPTSDPELLEALAGAFGRAPMLADAVSFDISPGARRRRGTLARGGRASPTSRPRRSSPPVRSRASRPRAPSS